MEVHGGIKQSSQWPQVAVLGASRGCTVSCGLFGTLRLFGFFLPCIATRFQLDLADRFFTLTTLAIDLRRACRGRWTAKSGFTQGQRCHPKGRRYGWTFSVFHGGDQFVTGYGFRFQGDVIEPENGKSNGSAQRLFRTGFIQMYLATASFDSARLRMWS